MKSTNSNVFEKFRNASKLAQRQDAEGNEAKFDIREDEEQSVKLQEIIDLLVAAGYFRARIKGLSSFDKVVGGMTWCIESCNVDVDVDLLFQENSTIGQKIALTEKIVSVLPKLKCPHRIEPHQIQGLDFIHIFPVIQWLVKRSMEFRQEMSSSVRAYAVNQFNKAFPAKDKHIETKRKAIENVHVVQEMYRPHRYYKLKNEPPPDLLSRVEVTLLEYGARGDLSKSKTPSEAVEASVPEEHELEQTKIQQLLDNMTITNEEFNESIALNAEDQKLLRRHYELLQHEIEDSGEKSRGKRQLMTLKHQREILDEKFSQLHSKKEELARQLSETSGSVEATKQTQWQAIAAFSELEKVEVGNPESVKEVEELVILSGNLRTQELQFREYCKLEFSRLKAQIQDANAASPSDGHDNKTVDEEVERQKVLRLQLAKKNRITGSLQRQLDDVPNRAELAQYQKRFLELYNQVAMKHKETKQYYTLYNTLEDTRLYLSKELSLLNSISENYLEILVTPSAKEEFLSQLESILESVAQSRRKVEVRLVEEKGKRDELSRSLQVLVDLQRRYVAAVKQLSIECKRHENLSAQYQSNN